MWYDSCSNKFYIYITMLYLEFFAINKKMPSAFKIRPEFIYYFLFLKNESSHNFFEMEGAPLSQTPWLGCAPDTAFPQLHKEPNGLTSQ